MSTYFTADSILNLIPAAGVVHFTDEAGESWSLPLIGWGVVVRHSEAEDQKARCRVDVSSTPPESEWMWSQSTELQPVILDNWTEPEHPRPMTVNAYREESTAVSHRIDLESPSAAGGR